MIMISTKTLTSTTVVIIDNNQKCFLNSKAAYYYDFWRIMWLCRLALWRCKYSFDLRNKSHLPYSNIKQLCKIAIIFTNITVFFLLQINAALSRRDFFWKHCQFLLTTNFVMVLRSIGFHLFQCWMNNWSVFEVVHLVLHRLPLRQSEWLLRMSL